MLNGLSQGKDKKALSYFMFYSHARGAATFALNLNMTLLPLIAFTVDMDFEHT